MSIKAYTHSKNNKAVFKTDLLLSQYFRFK